VAGGMAWFALRAKPACARRPPTGCLVTIPDALGCENFTAPASAEPGPKEAVILDMARAGRGFKHAQAARGAGQTRDEIH